MYRFIIIPMDTAFNTGIIFRILWYLFRVSQPMVLVPGAVRVNLQVFKWRVWTCETKLWIQILHILLVSHTNRFREICIINDQGVLTPCNDCEFSSFGIIYCRCTIMYLRLFIHTEHHYSCRWFFTMILKGNALCVMPNLPVLITIVIWYHMDIPWWTGKHYSLAGT